MASKPNAMTGKPKPDLKKEQLTEKEKNKRERQKERRRIEKLGENNENENREVEEEEDEELDEDDREMIERIRSLDLKDRESSPRRSTHTRTRYQRIPTIATIPVSHFAKSASEFVEYEETQLNIANIYDHNSVQSLFPEFNYEQDFSNFTGFTDALLLGCNNYGDLVDISKCQNDNQRTFLIKLQEVHANNYHLKIDYRDEGAIDDFVHYLLSLLEFDKYPIQVRTRLLLDLEIGQWLFATVSNFGIRSHESVYLSVMEDKNKKSRTYKRGRLQLTCGMVAAAQLRYRINEPLPYHMFGMLVVCICTSNNHQSILG